MPLVRSASLRGFTSLVRSLGGSPESLADAAGLPDGALESDEVMVPLQAKGAVMELAARTLDCADFGLRLSDYQDLSGLGPLAIAIRNSSSMGEALDCARRHLSLHNQGSTLAIEPDPRGVSSISGLRHVWHYEGAFYPQATENALLNAHRVITLLADGPYGLRSVELTHKPAAPLARLERAFDGVRVHPSQPRSMLRFPTRLLDRGITGAQAALRDMALLYLNQQSAESASRTTAEARSAIDALLGSARLDVATVAGALGLPPRTLQRHLAREGTSVSGLTDEVRRARALQLLADPSLSISQAAGLLGLADQTTLTRLARRWWGMTARDKRAALAGL